MAKRAKPGVRPPAPTPDISKEIQDWLDFGGGSAKGKGRASHIESTDPRAEHGESEPEFLGFDSEGNAVFKDSAQPGSPQIRLSPTGEERGDTGLIHMPLPEHADLTDSVLNGNTRPVTGQDFRDWVEEQYGTKGAIGNKTILGERNGRPVINIALGSMPRSGLVINKPLPSHQIGPLINTPLGGGHPGSLINLPLGGLPTGPVINTALGTGVRKPTAADVLKLKAKLQAKAHGYDKLIA